jgi:adenine deaminase
MKKIAGAMLALGLLSSAHAADKIAVDMALTRATLIDVAGGKTVTGKSVLLKGDTIVAVVDDRQLSGYAAKTENTLKAEIYLEALRQTKERGMRISGHIPVQLTLAQMFDAGLGTAEHQSYLLRASTPQEKELTAQVAAGTLTAAADTGAGRRQHHRRHRCRLLEFLRLSGPGAA